jgi:hypothetical protein
VQQEVQARKESPEQPGHKVIQEYKVQQVPKVYQAIQEYQVLQVPKVKLVILERLEQPVPKVMRDHKVQPEQLDPVLYQSIRTPLILIYR